MSVQRLHNDLMWVDALCVDPCNDLEKGTQVQRMVEIFKEATEVLLRLGNNEGIANIFDWTCEPRARCTKPFITSQLEERHGASESSKDLAKHPYWMRAWHERVDGLMDCLR